MAKFCFPSFWVTFEKCFFRQLWKDPEECFFSYRRFLFVFGFVVWLKSLKFFSYLVQPQFTTHAINQLRVHKKHHEAEKTEEENFFADVAAKQSTVFASFLNWSEIATGSDVLVRLAWLRTLPHPLARIACFPLLILSSALSLPLSFSVLSQTLSPYCTRSSLSPLSHAPNRFPSNALSETVHRYTFVQDLALSLPLSLSLTLSLSPSLSLSLLRRCESSKLWTSNKQQLASDLFWVKDSVTAKASREC